MSVELYSAPDDGPKVGVWNLRATEIPAAERQFNWKMGFCAEIIGRDDNYRYQRAFRPRLLKDPAEAGKVVCYAFRPRDEPYLLDIRHEQRGYYVLHAGIDRPELVQIAESLLAELLIARELDKAAFQTSAFARTTLESIREVKDTKLKRSLLKTLNKANRPAEPFEQVMEKIKEAETLAVVSRQSIRRVHFDD